MTQLPPNFAALKQRIAQPQAEEYTPEYAAQLDAMLRELGIMEPQSEQPMASGGGEKQSQQAQSMPRPDQGVLAAPAQSPPAAQQQIPPEQTGYAQPTYPAPPEKQEPPVVAQTQESAPGPSLAGPGGGKSKTVSPPPPGEAIAQDNAPAQGGQPLPNYKPGQTTAIPIPNYVPGTAKAVPIPNYVPPKAQPAQPEPVVPAKPKGNKVLAKPTDKPGTSFEWQDKKQGWNMETTIVQGQDGKMYRVSKPTTKILTPEEQQKAIDDVMRGGSGVPSESAPAKQQAQTSGDGKPAAEGVGATETVPGATQQTVPSSQEAEKQMMNKTKEAGDAVAMPKPAGRIRRGAGKPQSALPPSFNGLKMGLQDEYSTPVRFHWTNQLAGLGDVSTRQDNEKGRLMDVELSNGRKVPIRKTTSGYEVDNGRGWQQIAPDTPLGKVLATKDPLAGLEEGSTGSAPESYTMNGQDYQRYKLGKGATPFNLSRPGEPIGPGDKHGYFVLDSNGNPHIEDDEVGTVGKVVSWPSDMAGQNQAKETYLRNYEDIGKEYRHAPDRSGKVVPESFDTSVDNFARGTAYAAPGNAATSINEANRTFGDNGNEALTKIVSDVVNEQVTKQQADAEERAKQALQAPAEAAKDSSPDARAKLLGDMVDTAITRAGKAGIVADLSPKRKRQLVLEMTKKAFDATLKDTVGANKAAAGIKTSTSQSQEVSRAAAGKVNHQTAQAIKDASDEYAAEKVAHSREWPVFANETTDGIDHATNFNTFMYGWQQAYPHQVLEGRLTGDQIAELNPYKVMDELWELRNEPGKTTDLQNRINQFYHDVSKAIGVPAPPDAVMKMGRVDTAGNEIRESDFNFTNSADVKNTTAETDDAKVSTGNGTPAPTARFRSTRYSGATTAEDMAHGLGTDAETKAHVVPENARISAIKNNEDKVTQAMDKIAGYFSSKPAEADRYVYNQLTRSFHSMMTKAADALNKGGNPNIKNIIQQVAQLSGVSPSDSTGMIRVFGARLGDRMNQVIKDGTTGPGFATDYASNLLGNFESGVVQNELAKSSYAQQLKKQISTVEQDEAADTQMYSPELWNALGNIWAMSEGGRLRTVVPGAGAAFKDMDMQQALTNLHMGKNPKRFKEEVKADRTSGSHKF